MQSGPNIDSKTSQVPKRIFVLQDSNPLEKSNLDVSNELTLHTSTFPQGKDFSVIWIPVLKDCHLCFLSHFLVAHFKEIIHRFENKRQTE